jgi:glycosyltransferase involved in cell wall biosynthesis
MVDVAVIVPTFNRARTIEASVASLLAERDVALEVVVVDDGSTDDTVVRLGRRRDPRLRVLAHDHVGIAGARNTGIAASEARYVAFHDSDDLALPGRLARPVRHLDQHSELAFVVQNGRMLPPESAPQAPVEPWIAPHVAARLAAGPLTVAEVFRWNLGQLQGMCFRRDVLVATGPLDTSLRILDDLDLVLRVAARHSGAFLDVPAFEYRRGGGVARDRARVHEEAIAVAEKLVAACPEALTAIGERTFRHRQARRYARVARVRVAAGDLPGARRALARAHRLAPANLRYRWEALRLGWRRGTIS